MTGRLISADALAHDLEYDVELCTRALDDMNVDRKKREDIQWQKDCKQNCIWYISEQPTVDAIPISFIKEMIDLSRNVGADHHAESLEILLADWAERKEE